MLRYEEELYRASYLNRASYLTSFRNKITTDLLKMKKEITKVFSIVVWHHQYKTLAITILKIFCL